MSQLERAERLQIMLSPEELQALEDFRFKSRMPSRAAAVRELLRRGLASGGYLPAATGTKSAGLQVLDSARNPTSRIRRTAPNRRHDRGGWSAAAILQLWSRIRPSAMRAQKPLGGTNRQIVLPSFFPATEHQWKTPSGDILTLRSLIGMISPVVLMT